MTRPTPIFLLGTLFLCLVAGTAGAAPDQSFVIKEYLGEAWSNELVRFSLDKSIAGESAGYQLRGPDGRELPFQFVDGTGGARKIAFQAELSAFAVQTYLLERRNGGKGPLTDLRVEEEKTCIRVTNALTGLEVPTALGPYTNGPFLRMRLRSGAWVGASRLACKTAITNYAARVVAAGPVYAEIECRYAFEGGAQWQVTYRVMANEPVVVIDETCNLADGSAWHLMAGPGFAPTHALSRDQKKYYVKKLDYNGNAPLSLTAWPIWWNVNSVAFLGLFKVPEGSAVLRGGGDAVVAMPQSGVALAELGDWKKTGADDGQGLLDDIAQAEKQARKQTTPFEDLLGAAAGRAGLWANPGQDGQSKNIPLCTRAGGELFFACSLAGPARHWLLAALTTADNLVADERMSAIQKQMVKHCETPLDEVKDMVLEWDSQTAFDYPRLVVTRRECGTRPAVQARMEKRKALANQDTPGHRVRTLLDPALRIFRGALDQPAQSMHTIHRCERIMRIAVAADMLLGSDVLTPEEHAGVLGFHAIEWGRPMLTDKDIFSQADIRYARAQIAFLGYKLASPDYYSLERNYRANPNMTSARYCAMTILAALVPDHPMAKVWAQGGLDEVERELKEWTGPNGGWIECPHYQTVAMSSILLLSFGARNAGFADYLQDARLARAIRYLARISTPPDPRFDNKRHFPPAGNTYQRETTGLFGVMAKVYRATNPELADELQWAWIQQGRNRYCGIGDNFFSQVLYDDFEPKGAPAWGSEHFPGSGAVLRNGFPGERETYMYLLQGGFAEHYDHDRGSFELWGKGRPLCLDWGYSFKVGRMPAWQHNRVDVGNWGSIRKFKTFEAADYLHSSQEGWDRQVLLVKSANPLGPNYFVVRDAVAHPSANWWLWLYTANALQLSNDVVRVTGLHDVDLDIWLAPKLARHLKPGKAKTTNKPREQPVASTDLAGDLNKASEDAVDAALADMLKESAAAKAEPPGNWIETRTETSECHDMCSMKQEPLTQEGLALPVSKDEPVFCVLYPRLKSEAAAAFTPLAEGRGVKVTHAAGTDFIFLSAAPFEFREGDIGFKGRAGVIRIRGKSIDLTLSEGGELLLGKDRLSSAEPATQTFPEK